MKSQKSRMLNHQLYLASDPELKKERIVANTLFQLYNSCKPDEDKKMQDIINKLIPDLGENTRIKPPFFCDYGYNIHIGDNFFANYNCTILDVAGVYIGDYVKLAPNVSIFTASHPIDPEVRASEYEFGIDIHIGNHVWIGGNSIINPGITIGDNCVIGSGSVVCNDIPQNTVAVGNPCRVIRELSDKDKKFYFKEMKIATE